MKKILVILVILTAVFNKLTAERTTITLGDRWSGYTYVHLKDKEEIKNYAEVINSMDLELTDLTYPLSFLEEIVESNNLDKELLESGLHIINGHLFADFFGVYIIVDSNVYLSVNIADHDGLKTTYFWTMIKRFYPNVKLPF